MGDPSILSNRLLVLLKSDGVFYPVLLRLNVDFQINFPVQCYLMPIKFDSIEHINGSNAKESIKAISCEEYTQLTDLFVHYYVVKIVQ
jgi:hypothetical protein